MVLVHHTVISRSCGPTDKASDYESGDSNFESWQDRLFGGSEVTNCRQLTSGYKIHRFTKLSPSGDSRFESWHDRSFCESEVTNCRQLTRCYEIRIFKKLSSS